MSTLWHYAKNGQQMDPVTPAELRQLVNAGEIGPRDLVWKEGLSRWIPAGQVNGLFPQSVTALPPPAPAASASVPQTSPTDSLPEETTPRRRKRRSYDEDDEFDNEDEDFRPRRRRRRKKQKSNTGLIIGGVIGGVVAVGLLVTLLIIALIPSRPRQVAQQPVRPNPVINPPAFPNGVPAGQGGQNILLSHNGFLPINGKQDHVVELKANVTYTITVTSNQFDPMVELHDMNNRFLDGNDDDPLDPNTLNSRLTYRCTQNGRYRIAVVGFDPNLDTGNYQLIVRH